MCLAEGIGGVGCLTVVLSKVKKKLTQGTEDGVGKEG